MIITLFQVDYKDGKSRFFEQTFPLADININVAFGMLFFTLGNVKANFNNQNLR